jgi:hypothetical protein
MTVSTDLIYDVLRQHEPDHILMQSTWADAASGLLDIARLGSMLARIEGRISHQRLNRISPLAVPIMLEVGKEPVHRRGARSGAGRCRKPARRSDGRFLESPKGLKANRVCLAEPNRDSADEGHQRGHRLGGETLVADRCGALYWPDEATLIVADLHLEKGSSFARFGNHLPPYDTAATLIQLGDGRCLSAGTAHCARRQRA